MSPARLKLRTNIVTICLLMASQACSDASPAGGDATAPSSGSGAGGMATAGSTNATSGAAGSAGMTTGGAGSSTGGALDPPGGAGANASAGTSGSNAGTGGNAGNGNAGVGGTGGASSTAGSSSAGSGGAVSVSCPATALAAGNAKRTLQSGGKSREYILHVPSGYTGKTAVPLLVDFAGHGGTGDTQQRDSPYPKVADADNVIMAFPTPLGDWNMGPCCADGVDDIGFAKDLVADVEKLACVDPKRVYASGFSMGGGMSHQLACHAADVFAAVAPAAFDLLEEHLPTCKPQRPITVISFRGTDDTLAPYQGGLSNLVRPINFLGAAASMKKWAELDGCTGQAADLGNNCQGYAASQCPGGVEVIECTKQGGGHEQGNATLGWPVLKRHQLP